VGYIARIGKMRNEYNIFIGKAEGKRTLGSWEANIKIHIQHRV